MHCRWDRLAGALLSLGMLATNCVAVLASTHVWIGPANGLWSNGGNWTGNAPSSGEAGGTIVQFNAGSTSTMDIAGLVVDQITFTGDNNTINGSTMLSLNSDVALNNILNSAGSNMLGSSLSLGLTGHLPIFIQVDAGAISMSCSISGNNAVRINTAAGSSVAYLGNNSYTGSTTVANGRLDLNSNGLNAALVGNVVVGTGSGTGAMLTLLQSLEIADNVAVTVLGDGTFDVNGNIESIGTLTINQGTVTLGSGNLTLGGALDMTGGTISGAGMLGLGGDLSANFGTAGATIAATVLLNSSRTFAVNDVNAQPSLTISGVIKDGSGASGITKTGAGTLLLNSSGNLYTETTTCLAGLTQLNGSVTPIIPGPLVIGNNTDSADTAIVRNLNSADIAGDVTVNSSGQLDCNNFGQNIGALNGGGKVMIGNSDFFVGFGDHSGSFSGVISGTGTVSKAGAGIQTFAGNNTYSGSTFVNAGEMSINGQQAGSSVQIASTAKLSGAGKIGSAFNAGIIAPSGASFSMGSVTFSATGQLNLNIDSVTPGAFSSLNVTGVVTINSGATLNVTAGPSLTAIANTKLVLIANDAADPISGTFANVANASTLTFNGVPYTVNYQGGSNNDLDLTAANVAPVVSVAAQAAPSTAFHNQSVAFSVGVIDANNDPLSFAWDFGDNTTGAGATPTHTYASIGIFKITVTVTDGQGGSASSAVTLAVNNNPPVITSTSNATPNPAGTNQPVVFQAAATDADNDPLVFAWDFGDNSTGTGSTATHTYASTGSFKVTVTVTDGQGGSASSAFTLAVNNNPPVFASQASATPNPAGVGQIVSFSTAATDPNGDALAFAWDFADGTFGSGANTSHTFAAAGIFNVKVIVADGRGGIASSSLMVTVLAPRVGDGLDSDGDGFSDVVEITAGTSPQNGADTPTGAAAGIPEPLDVSRISIKLNFAMPASDTIAFSGTLPVPAGLAVSGQKVIIDVGGISKSFTLSSKGSGGDKSSSFKLIVKSTKGTVTKQNSKYSLIMRKGKFAAMLADEGLANKNDNGSPHTVLVSVIFNKTLFQASKTVKYKAKLGKSGSAN